MLHHLINKKRKKEFFDYLLYFFVFTTPLFELPQAIEIYTHHSAHNVSILTWSYFLLSNIAWLTYGVRKHLKPIILTYTLYSIVEILIIVGIIKYS